MKVSVNGDIIDIGGGSVVGEVYSTEETRIGTYLDKPLYQITVIFTLAFSSGQTSKKVPIPDAAVPVFWEGYVGPTSWAAEYPIPYIEYIDSALVYICCLMSNGNLYIINRWGSNSDEFPCRVTVKYTKSTD